MPNRLARASSPYLRQHADDPVDWYPWGEEAFAHARETERPIFLSVGYASCHWCHVMQRESFRDPATAGLLNDRYVSVKVDREVRPDVDELYLAYVVAATGHGGWPMSVILTPELRPVFGGTYFPPESHPGVPSFQSILERISTSFSLQPDVVARSAEDAMDYLRVMFAPPKPGAATRGVVDLAFSAVLDEADPVNGGFGSAPKFPQPTVAQFLLAYHRITGDERALALVEAEAVGIVGGGIYDQAGGGIARYSVDDRWLVPHFEKMLYDNAQLLSTLAGLHIRRPRDAWRRAMGDTAAFLERDLLMPSGGYASSLSADTQGEEGATYVWGWEELESLLDAEELALAREHLGVSREGNWEGSVILTRENLDDDPRVNALLSRLFSRRQRRPQPDRDGKVIVSWNALAAIGLMDAGAAVGDDAITKRGVELVRFLLAEAAGADGQVRRIVGDTHQPAPQVLDDAAALALAAVRAFETADEREFLGAAERILAAAEATFASDGVWFMTPASTELPLRPRERHDGPTPSGPHLAALAALSLAAHGVRASGMSATAEQVLERSASFAEWAPLGMGSALHAMCELLEQRG